MFYVYVHKRKSDNTIFYVGKGHGERYKSFEARNKWWNRIANKNGVIAEKLCYFKDEADAYNYELKLIRKLKKKGFDLCNILEGGSGGFASKVFCSNGMFFLSLTEAAKFCSKNGIKAKGNHIGSCARGDAISSYGYSWSFSGFPDSPENKIDLKKYKKRRIFCSNGMEFKSVSSAVRWVKNNVNIKASTGDICRCADKDGYSAYGHSWSYKKIPNKPIGKSKIMADLFSKKVCAKNNNGYFCFESISDAARWIASEKGFKSPSGNIVSCLKGRLKTAYSYQWEYK